jgi:hypothetical protein
LSTQFLEYEVVLLWVDLAAEKLILSIAFSERLVYAKEFYSLIEAALECTDLNADWLASSGIPYIWKYSELVLEAVWNSIV